MNYHKPGNRLQLVTQIASDAAARAQAFYSNRASLAVSHKSPTQAVTDADREIETDIHTRLSNDFPGEAIVGEEFGGQSKDSYWTIDPIDGTANFLNGLPLWGVAIGHISHGVPDLGVIALPELNINVCAEDKELFLNNLPFTHRPAPVQAVSLGQADVETLSESLELHQTYRRAGFAVYHWRCSAVSLAWTALGRISGHLHRRTQVWDIVPGAALCRAAGLDVRLNTQPDGETWIKTGEPAIHSVAHDLWDTDQREGQ